jgi:uncharacterized protein (DUF2141 family)
MAAVRPRSASEAILALMKQLLIAGSFACFAAAASAAETPACLGEGPVRLTVDVTGVRSPDGEMAVTVYPDDPGRFLAPGGKLVRARVEVRAPVTEACFNLPAPGAYAVAVYHDANANHDFDRTIVGMPTEGFGFSNNPVVQNALPDFASVRTSVPRAGKAISVKLRYP